MADLWAFMPGFVQGAGVTMMTGVMSIVMMLAVGLLLALSCRAPSKWLPGTAAFVIEVLRANSAIVLLFWVYYAVPLLPGNYKPGGLAAAVIVLGINGGAYAAEIIRAAANSVPRGQYDACQALGIGFWRRELRIVLPQSLAIAMPSLSGMSVELFKWSAVVSLVGVQDLLHWGEVARQQTGRTVAVYVFLMVAYYLFGRLIMIAFNVAGNALASPGMKSSSQSQDGSVADVGLPVYTNR